MIGGGLAGYSGGQIGAGIQAAGGVGPYLSNAAHGVGNFIAHPIASTASAAKDLFTSPPNVAGATAAGATGVDRLLGSAAGATTPALGAAAGTAGAGAAGATGTSFLDTFLKGAGVVAPIIGGIQAANAAKNAARIQSQGTQAAIDEQRRQFDVTQGNLAPYLNAGKETLPALLDRIGVGPRNPKSKTYGSLLKPFTGASLASEPGYQFERAQGEQGINRAASAAGRYDSGAVLKDLSQFNTDYAGTKYNEAFNRDSVNKTDTYNKLAGVAGTGQAAANQIATAGSSNSNAISELLTGGANARAAGVVGSSNAINNGVTGAFNNLNQNRLLQLLANNGSGRSNYAWGP